MNVRAIDMRYNLMMLGNVIDKEMFYNGSGDMEKARMYDDENKENCLEFLSRRGCPQGINDEMFKNGCIHFDDDCRKCWKQEPNEYKHWREEEENDDEEDDWEV
jgi:hypothetical protein